LQLTDVDLDGERLCPTCARRQVADDLFAGEVAQQILQGAAENAAAYLSREDLQRVIDGARAVQRPSLRQLHEQSGAFVGKAVLSLSDDEAEALEYGIAPILDLDSVEYLQRLRARDADWIEARGSELIAFGRMLRATALRQLPINPATLAMLSRVEGDRQELVELDLTGQVEDLRKSEAQLAAVRAVIARARLSTADVGGAA
jgi:hypothetical protein